MRQPVPDLLRLPRGGHVRFALGTAEGPRSTVWSIKGAKKFDDVYIGPRDSMGVAKLSLHQSGIWRRAFTSEEALRRDLPDDQDRVMNRWDLPQPIEDGWLHAVSISIPVTSIQEHPPPLKPLRRREKINFYQVQPETHTARFDVLLKRADAPTLNVENIHAQVGRIELPSGGCVWVFATELTAVDGRAEEDIENLRQLTRDQFVRELGLEGFRDYAKPVGLTWGSSNDDGRPVIIDLGDLRTSE